MIFCPALTQQLGALTEALDDPGTDLLTVIDSLADEFSEAIPSFLGLGMTVLLDGIPVTLTAIDPGLALDSGTSLVVSLNQRTGTGCRVVFYARNPGAFAHLANTRAAAGPGDQLQPDVRLTALSDPPQAPGITGLTELRVLNRAIGVLISRGFSPASAHAELRRRAAGGQHGIADAARRVVTSTNARPHPRLGAAASRST